MDVYWCNQSLLKKFDPSYEISFWGVEHNEFIREQQSYCPFVKWKNYYTQKHGDKIESTKVHIYT